MALFIVETGVCALVLAVPLAFNPYSQRAFEPEKVALFRSIVLLMALAWAIGRIETVFASLRSPSS
ncbi:MAG: hypothetical protein ACUVV0_09085, partial [Anaerolineae bacterium]